MFASNTSAANGAANYIEDVFSTYLYTGNGSTQTITNGIDLSTYGGLVWIKSRNFASNNVFFDTARGSPYFLVSNNSSAQTNGTNEFGAFNSTGFTVPVNTVYGNTNYLSYNYASWTFRKQPKFMTICTWTGNGTSQVISHDLGSVPGCIIVKKTSGVDNWGVYHRSIGNTKHLRLNTTDAAVAATLWNNTDPTSTQFSVSGNYANEAGFTYVAYLFAHNAGGFGLTGTDNVISCGSFTTDSGGNFSVSTGYEPQLVIVKRTDATQNWFIADTMRGFSQTQFATLNPNLSAAETANNSNYIAPNATGFGSIGNQFLSGSATYIYIAIRRGPMKVPTSGTSVFAPVLTTTNNTITTNFPVDLSIFRADRGTTASNFVFDRLRGNTARLVTSTTGVEATATAYPFFDNNTGTALTGFTSGLLGVDWAFRRAPGFFDEVCYTGTGSAQNIQHNLGVAPELIIEKCRNNLSAAQGWNVYAAPQGATKNGVVNSTAAFTTQSIWNNTAPTASVFSINGGDHSSGDTYVAYLFATCAGVSKVGSYTGNGSSQTINCGFTSGARFIFIKRTDAASPWYVWDTARGIVAGNDPYLFLNSSAAEVNGFDDVDTASTGFIVNYYVGGVTDINTSGGSYIYLAIA